MKKLLCALVVVLSMVGCGVTHHSQSGSKPDESYIKVLRENQNYPDVVLEVDGVETPVKKLYKVNDYQKAASFAVAPGKHQVRVKSAGRIIVEESVFVGVQETRRILLR